MKKPRIKNVHNPTKLPGNHIRIGTVQYGVGAKIEDDTEGTIWHLMSLLDGTRTQNEIVQTMLQAYPEMEEASIYEALDVLIQSGFVEEAEPILPSNLSLEELNRYTCSANYFSWVDTQPRASSYEIQSRLKRSRVTILGLGGTGSTITMSLTAAGIGHIHCIDFDVVEVSNLNRQLLYREADIGLSKVECAAAHLKDLNSHVQVTGQSLKVTCVNDVVSLMEACDFFILCADKPTQQIQAWVNEAALMIRRPWLFSLYAGPMIVVGMFVPYETPCYECLLHTESIRHGTGNIGTPLFVSALSNAVIAPTSSMSGQLGALETIYYLGGLKPQTMGRVFHQNLMIYDHCYYVESAKWAECPACATDGVRTRSQAIQYKLSVGEVI